MAALKTSYKEIKQYYPGHEFHPYLEVFARCALTRCSDAMPWNIESYSEGELERAVETLNQMVEDIRDEVRSSAFKRVAGDFERSSNKNFKSLVAYVDSLFMRHSRLLVLRVDLAYFSKCATVSMAKNTVTYAEVKQHKEKLLKYLQKKLLVNCFVGFAWKLEYGLHKGYHYHVMFFLDGSKVREDVTIARLLGEYWRDIVTEGRGLYFNCNAVKRKYRSCGIGMVNHSDLPMRENLTHRAALYLTKSDYYFKMVVPDKGRCFGRGVMPLLSLSGVKRGRPRKSVVQAPGLAEIL
ncbi:YagK/YfjJ domain-containing protein [Pseudomonas sp. P42]|uniref:YagK/YfjJ domain-containing protein n=1 Tax=Pseudomonas sp. P42 TaxID=1080160 RepID=UPI001B31B737|nr:inovirus-type Gp2 protein [Pseudomonas sp. P42]MBP5953428.1 inovirus-type Gp2 protein [Pseudomonas sp. P42]